MPRAIGIVLSRRMATMVELNTVLSVEDVWDLLEILSIDDHNAAILNPQKD